MAGVGRESGRAEMQETVYTNWRALIKPKRVEREARGVYSVL